jgi:LacI family transcriptional regulator, repressor for deo operon, udp, cdd, tsx, nupC, and nupG
MTENAEQARRRPTIDDVARRAGVSSAAVSFAMNGRRGVGEATRARILDAAAELGWSPSAPARALGRGRAGAIGLLLARPVETLEVDPFFLRFLAGIERALAHTDHALLLRVLDDDGPVDPEAYGRLAAQGRVDGFLLTDVEGEDPRMALLAKAGLPAVVAGRPDGPCPFPALETRHAEGLAAATAHLIERGHERIGFLGGLARYEFEQARLQAWRAELARARLEPGPVAFGDPSAALAERPTALVCTSDALAAGALAEARERGLSVPGALAITGFDDSSLAALSSPPLTSVRIDYAQFGEAAAAALLAAIAGAPPPAFEPAAPRLIVRASSGSA